MWYKSRFFDFDLPEFPGYTTDQWGIKAHNRPWIAEHGRWERGLRIIELGGAYSRLPEWLGERYDMEAWVGDDFGGESGDALWSRWGDPRELPEKFPDVTYRFENFGPGSSYPSDHFDRLFSVSTLEHIRPRERLDVLRDAHRALAPRGVELHTIDIALPSVPLVLLAASAEKLGAARLLGLGYRGGIAAWWRAFERSGVDMSRVRQPTSLKLLSREYLVESPDVILRWYPPNGEPKPYRPKASLLLIIEDMAVRER